LDWYKIGDLASTMTSNGVTAVTLRYYAECVTF